MAMERSTEPARPLPLPPRLSASPATVGAILTRATASGAARECRSPRSLLSRILHRGGGGGFRCRLRLPRYCSSGAAKENAGEDAAKEEEARVAAAAKVVGRQAEVRESPRNSLGKKAAAEVSPSSLGLGASLVLLLSKSAAELSRMAELRAQMERLVLDVKAGVRSSSRSNASDHPDSASVVNERVVFAGDDDASAGGGGNAGNRAAVAMDQMEAELEAELTRLQLASNNDERAITRRDHHLGTDTKSVISSECHSRICVDGDSVDDDGATDQGCKEDEDNEQEEEEERGDGQSPPHGGVPARELERKLHELLQSRHEERIAELESALEGAKRKLQEKEREVCRWRDTAKLVTRHKDESRLR